MLWVSLFLLFQLTLMAVSSVRFVDFRSGEPSAGDEDYERAQKAILDAITTVEDRAQRLIASEVETLFHGPAPSGEEPKSQLKKRASKAVTEATQKVKQSVTEHPGTHVYPFEDHPYPYAHPEINNKHRHRDHRLLQSIEAAEHAVLNAIEAEVGTLFPKDHESKHNASVQNALQKTAKQVKEHHEHRRNWMLEQFEKGIDEYSSPDVFLQQ